MNTIKLLALFTTLTTSIFSADFNYLGTKQPYNVKEISTAPTPNGYKPFFVNHLGRHGSRHLSSPKYDVSLYELLSIAEKEKAITPEGLKLKNSIAQLMEIEKGNYGLLTDVGVKEQKEIAKRFYENNKDIFGKDVIASSTYVERAQQSRDAFLEELGEYTPNINFKVSTNSKKDILLRFFDLSPEYEEFSENGNWKKELNTYSKSKNFNNEVLNQLFSKEFIKKLENGEFKLKDSKGKVVLKNPTDAVRNLYDLYIIQASIGKNLGFGDFFSEEQLKWYEEVDNLSDFYEKGPGKNGEDIATNIALPLLENFIVTSDEAIKNQNISANLRFAHAETTIPFITLLDINGYSAKEDNMEKVYEKWLGRDISGMSTNIQWIFYKNDKNDVLVKILHNEKDAELPIATTMKPYYKWDDVKNFYTSKLK
ncbi:histidine-type phosphatase [uncultured Cetobacterium sp.]|uniref:histidine-type phosphatase n=1 Tax=uncultured Cetobacterium sp. TaxID=527638 RepID=UPI002615C5CA|nr:histidine-type phosphatase [uncultured Cetobacterium sp.]